jgi:hypothetical protein
LLQLSVFDVGSEVHVVPGKSANSSQLGPLQTNWYPKSCPGPQLVNVPFKVVMIREKIEMKYTRDRRKHYSWVRKESLMRT